MKLFFAFVWLLSAVVLFAYGQFTGDVRYIRGTNWSFAWVPLVLGLFNLARWWSGRRARAAQRALQLARATRHRPAAFRARREEPPDPNFNFTGEPPSEN